MVLLYINAINVGGRAKKIKADIKMKYLLFIITWIMCYYPSSIHWLSQLSESLLQ